MQALNFVLGTLEAGLALVVLRHLGRFGRAYPWLAALMAFFFLRAADRFYVAFAGDEPLALSALIDGLAVVLLSLLLFGMRKMIRGLEAVELEASVRQFEYERALGDYRTLMRHRIANPLATIRGGIQSLKEFPDLNREDQLSLLDSVHRAAERLEHVALSPSPMSSEETVLDARPRLDG